MVDVDKTKLSVNLFAWIDNRLRPDTCSYECNQHFYLSSYGDGSLSINLCNTMYSEIRLCMLPFQRRRKRSVPGKLAVRCSTRASWLTGLWAEFIAEIARHKISPSGMNCDWLIGDILIGDTSPAGGGTSTTVRS